MTTLRTKVNPLQIEHDRRKPGPPYNSVEFAEKSYKSGFDAGYLWRITLFNDGFEATHEIDAHGLREIRQWINEVLADEQ